jgi:obg-like ATPase 1
LGQEIGADVKSEDILAKTIIAEEATVRKAGGKFKMNPLFPSTTGKIKAVCNPKSLSERAATDSLQMLEQDKPVRDGTWTSAEIELINEKVSLIPCHPFLVPLLNYEPRCNSSQPNR